MTFMRKTSRTKLNEMQPVAHVKDASLRWISATRLKGLVVKTPTLLPATRVMMPYLPHDETLLTETASSFCHEKASDINTLSASFCHRVSFRTNQQHSAPMILLPPARISHLTLSCYYPENRHHPPAHPRKGQLGGRAKHVSSRSTEHEDNPTTQFPHAAPSVKGRIASSWRLREKRSNHVNKLLGLQRHGLT